MRHKVFKKRKVTWGELSVILSKAGILMGDEDIDHITLVKPRTILLHTYRREVKPAPDITEELKEDI